MSPQQSAPVLRHIAYYHKLLRVYGGYELNMERYPALVPEERELVHAIEAAAGLSDQAAPSQAYARRVDCAEMTSLISWYLHWRGLWDLRIRLCERVCGWADQGMLPDMSVLVGNLYVDQGWIHLQRGDIDHAESCASRGRGWLETTSDWIFAAELAAQIALRRQDYSSAIDGFELLRRETQNESRFFMVLSYRLADALREAGDPGRALALLEDLLERIGSPEVGDGIDDVHGRILYRIALQRRDAGQAGEALALARRSVVAFARSGIRAAERGAAIILVAGLLSQSGATDDCRNFLIGVQHQAERESDFETLTEITKALAGLESGSSPIRTDSLQLTDL